MWPKPHPLIPRLQFLISAGCQPTAPDKPHVAQTPPFDTQTSVSNPCRLSTYSTKQTQTPPFDTSTSVSTGCQHKAPNKPYIAQTHTLWYQQYLRHRTSRARPTWPKPPPFHTKTSVSSPCRFPTYSTGQAPHGPNPTLWYQDFSF